MTRALQTRQVGFTTHQSGHVMAPPDVVYEVEEEAPKRDGSRLFSDEWRAPNPWVTAAIWAILLPLAVFTINHVLTN